MKKILGASLVVVLVWLVGVELILGNTGTSSLIKKAKTVPAFTAVDTISKLVVLDSVAKTGMIDRYKYSLEELKNLFQKNEFRIVDDSYAYFYCAEGRHSASPKANMIVVAMNKSDNDVVAKGTSLFLEKTPQLETLENEQRNTTMLASVLQIQRDKGECFQIQ